MENQACVEPKRVGSWLGPFLNSNHNFKKTDDLTGFNQYLQTSVTYQKNRYMQNDFSAIFVELHLAT